MTFRVMIVAEMVRNRIITAEIRNRFQNNLHITNLHYGRFIGLYKKPVAPRQSLFPPVLHTYLTSSPLSSGVCVQVSSGSQC